MANITDVGTATAIVFGTSALAVEVISVAGSGWAREAVDVSHLGTTVARTFIPTDLYDPGQIELEVHHGDELGLDIPISAAAEVVTVTFPVPTGSASGGTLAGSAFVLGYDWTAPLEDKMTGTLPLKFTGALTWVDAA